MNAEMWRIGLALLLLLGMAWLPGLALCRVLAPELPRLTCVAVAPAVSAGLLYGVGQLLTSVGLPVDARLALALSALALGALAWAERASLGQWSLRRLPLSVFISWVVGAAVWIVGIRDRVAVPPHNDGYNHGFFVARLARFATLDPAVVMPHDVVNGGTGAAFYPLALHQQAAILVRLLNINVGLAWTLTSLSVTVFALPLGMYAVGLYLFADHRRAAGCAIVASLMPGVTYSTAWWGGFTLAAGFAIAPGALLCLLFSAGRPARARSAALSGIALAGVAAVHTSLLTLVAVLGIALVGGPAITSRSLVTVLRRVGSLSVPFIAALLVLAPVLTQLHRGLGERASLPPRHGIPVTTSTLEVLLQFAFFPPATPIAIVLTTWVGLGLAIRYRTGLAWMAAWLFVALTYVWLASFPSALIVGLTSSWYSDRVRLSYILAFLAIPFISLVVTPTGPARSTMGQVWRAATPALLLVIAITSARASAAAVHEDYHKFSLIGADERQAFQFLAQHARPGEHVLNQHQDDSPWMYSLYDVTPIFALKTNNFESSDWNDALYLSRHVADASHDARTDALLASFDVHYVYVDTRVFPTDRADIDPARLANSPAFRLVFRHGDARVFELLRKSPIPPSLGG